jgi:hypothetical protein
MPSLKVSYLGSANCVQNAKDNFSGCLRYERAVKAGATLLNGREVKRRGVSNRLDMLGIRDIAVRSGNGRLIHDVDCLRECGIEIREIRVLGAAVPSIPTGVHGKLCEVRQPFFGFIRSSRLTAWQSAKVFKVDWLRANRFQEGVQEHLVAILIIGIVVDVLGHVCI